MNKREEIESCLEDIGTELGLFIECSESSRMNIPAVTNEIIKMIGRYKAEASAYQTMTAGSNIDAMVFCLIKDMSGVELWRKVFNKMTKPAKRQLIGELLNSCLGSGYSTKSSIFDPNSKDDD